MVADFRNAEESDKLTALLDQTLNQNIKPNTQQLNVKTLNNVPTPSSKPALVWHPSPKIIQLADAQKIVDEPLAALSAPTVVTPSPTVSQAQIISMNEEKLKENAKLIANAKIMAK